MQTHYLQAGFCFIPQGFLGGQSQCCQIHSWANFSNPKWRIHPSDIKHDLNFLSADWHASTVRNCIFFCCQKSWDHKDHYFPLCLQSQWITSTVCQSPVDIYLSWQFGLKFPLHVYKEQQEIPSEIKKMTASWLYLHPKRHHLGVESYK